LASDLEKGRKMKSGKGKKAVEGRRKKEEADW
jgi:hypothetical protein